MSDLDPVLDAVPPHWLAAPFILFGGWLMRVLIGRHFKSIDRLARRVEDFAGDIAVVREDIAQIKGHLGISGQHRHD